MRRSKLAISVLMLMSALFLAVVSANQFQPVQGAATITLSPTFASIGGIVSFTGSGFAAFTGTSFCTMNLRDAVNTNVTINTFTCVESGTSVSGSFVVPPPAGIKNPYTVIVKGAGGLSDIGFATFTIVFIEIKPSEGARGSTVLVNASLGGSDTTCSLSGSVVGTQSCVKSTGGNYTGNFVVANVVPGPYKVRATSSPSGVFVEATFIVKGPSIELNNTFSTLFGKVGNKVGVNGTDYSFADTTCTITSPTAAAVVSLPACAINAGTGKPLGNFTIGSVAPGSYVIRVSGNTGDFAEATLIVGLAVGSLVLNPTNATTGSTVTFRATGFQSSDTSCVVQSANGNGAPGSNMLLITSPTCAMSGQVATGTFIVGSLATTNINWNVTVKGTPANDIPVGAWALFNVTAQISLSPTTGSNGTLVGVTGTGFSSTASTICTLGVTPAVNFTDKLCGISGSTGHVSASFRVFNAVAGLYLINVTDSNGFFAGTTFQVGMPSAIITISPNTLFAPPGGFVGISGSGFHPQDTVCTITPIASLFTVSSCTVSSGVVAGSITVLTTAPPGLYVITVTGNKGDFAANYLGVNAVTTQTSTIVTTSVSTTATSTSTTLTTTGVSTSFSTTTQQTTGISTWIFTSKTATTLFGETTTTVVSTFTTSSIFTFLTSTTVTTTTTITHTLGQIIQPATRAGFYPDALGVLALLSLAIPMLFRRLVD